MANKLSVFGSAPPPPLVFPGVWEVGGEPSMTGLGPCFSTLDKEGQAVEISTSPGSFSKLEGPLQQPGWGWGSSRDGLLFSPGWNKTAVQ